MIHAGATCGIQMPLAKALAGVLLAVAERLTWVLCDLLVELLFCDLQGVSLLFPQSHQEGTQALSSSWLCLVQRPSLTKRYWC